MLLNGKEQVHFWRELERVEQWLSTGAGAAAGRIYDSMGRPGEQAFANYGNQLVAAGARVERVREALDQSGPMAKRLVMQQLSGIGLSTVWDILVAACKEIALYYGGSVVAGAVVGGAVGSLAFGVGAAPGAVIGTAAGSQVGIWVLALLGLKELAEGLAKMVPAAMAHYERGFREAWGAMPENRSETWNRPALPTGNALAGSWQMAQGHVILVTAILTALVAYLTRGKGNKAVLMQDIRNSRRLGPRFADWLVENERRLIAQPQLQSRPNNTVAMAMEGAGPSGGHGATAAGNGSRIDIPTNDGSPGRGFVRFSSDFDTHILARDFDVPLKRGIGGAHNLDEFNKYRNTINVVETLDHPSVPGIQKIRYQMQALDPAGNPTGGFRSKIFEKTVFDPQVISPQDFLLWGRQAAAQGQSIGPLNRTWTGVAPNGLSFMGYLDEAGAVRSFFPDF